MRKLVALKRICDLATDKEQEVLLPVGQEQFR